jgi:hypothetical protein
VDDGAQEHDVLGQQGLDGTHIAGLDGRTERAHALTSSSGDGGGATLVRVQGT